MSGDIRGLHHVTAISGDAQGNLDFYTKGLGLRLVKRTVNFDAPEVYHLYYGNREGTPGTAMTFFPFPGSQRGRVGRGQVSITQFAVPSDSLGFWEDRLPRHGARVLTRETVMGEERLVAEDPEGLPIALVVPAAPDPREPWLAHGVGEGEAIRGFRGVTLALGDGTGVAAILTGAFGYIEAGRQPSGDGTLVRYRLTGGNPADIVDVVSDRTRAPGAEAAGTVHHVAFSVADRAAQDRVRTALTESGQRVTPQIDRDYFWSIYFRTPGGVLFEVATEEPGFAIDEPVERLGESLRLPKQHEHLRTRLERLLPPLTV